MANNPSAPLRFGPHAILEAVEQLIVNDNTNGAARGWTSEEIKDSMQTHRQQEIEEELPQYFDNTLRVELKKLLRKGDLKVVGVPGKQPYHYTLSPPYLPLWFGPETVVLQAVKALDDLNNAGGSTWKQIRGSLKSKYQPGVQPLPPDFDTVLRAMLSVLRQRGHLTWGVSGPGHYTRRHDPAPDEPNRIEIPGYLWCYYLGYKLGAGDALDDSSDEDKADALMPNNPNAPSWFRPRMVLHEIEQLVANDMGNGFGTALFGGWTCEKIRDSLMATHQQKLPQGFDLYSTLRATLATLCKRGYLMERRDVDEPRYMLSMNPPCFPLWFGPDKVLQAVTVLDDKFPGGFTSRHIMDHFNGIHVPSPQLPWLVNLVETMLSVLHQRGRLTTVGSSGPQHYTRRHAPVTTNIPDTLFCYYVGYKLGGRYNLDDGVEELEKAAAEGLRSRFGKKLNVPREGFVIDRETHTEPFQPFAGDLGDDNFDYDYEKKWFITAGAPQGEVQDVGVPQNTVEQQRFWYTIWTRVLSCCGHASQATPLTLEERKRRRKVYMIWRFCLSLFGHGILLLLSFKFGFGEETSGHDEEGTSKKWLRWGLMNLIVPSVVFTAMVIAQKFIIDLEDISPDIVYWCKIVNLATITLSKVVYSAIKEAPVANVKVRVITAHAVAVVIDVLGAVYLNRKKGCLDQDMGG